MSEDSKALISAAGTVGLFVLVIGFFIATGVTNLSQLIGDLLACYLLSWGLYAFLSKESRTETRNRFLLTTAVLVFTVVGGELLGVVGLVDYRGVFRAHYTTSTLEYPGFEYDRDLLWSRDPYSKVAGTFNRGNIASYFCLPPQELRRFDVRYDRHGFRNSSDLAAADIVLVGDSYVEAPIVEESQTLARHLSRLQGASVANLGISGYGPQQELLVLERFALPLNPKIVVWVFFEGNDLQDIEMYKRQRESLSSQPPALVRLWFRSMTRNLLLTLLHVREGCAPAQAVERYRGAFIDQQGGEIPMYFMPRDEVSAKDSWKIQEAVHILAQGGGLTRQRGIRHVVVFAPTKYRVHKDLPTIKPAAVFQDWVLDDLPDRLRRLLAKDAPEIEYLDLTPVLRDEAARGHLAFFQDDTHWNAEGHRIVAEALNRFLSSRNVAAR